MNARVSYRRRRGFGLVEVVVASAIIGAALSALVPIGHLAFRAVDEAGFRIRASYLTEEGIEALRFLRDAGWSANVSALPTCTPRYLALVAGVWQISSVPEPAVDGIARSLRFEAVTRDGSDNITGRRCTLAGSDLSTRAVTVGVSWSNRGKNASTTISTYLTDLFDN